jgi:mono/diheme cytochrome c family protein
MDRRAGLLLAAALACGLAACDAGLKGDAARGEKVHEACLQCHGTGVYLPPVRKIDTPDALRREVARWGDYYNPALSEQEIEDLVAYLDRDFYRF